MFLELNTIGCSHLVFVIAGTTACVGADHRTSRPGDCRRAGLASLPGHRRPNRRTGSSNSREAMPRSASWPNRTASACLRFEAPARSRGRGTSANDASRPPETLVGGFRRPRRKRTLNRFGCCRRGEPGEPPAGPDRGLDRRPDRRLDQRPDQAPVPR